jgi:hypothetical protein
MRSFNFPFLAFWICASALALRGAEPSAAGPQAGSVTELTARLQAKSATWAERTEIEAQLQAAKREDVLPAMFSVLAEFKQGRGGLFYGTDPSPTGKTLPWYDQVWLIADRVWQHHAKPLPGNTGDPGLCRLMIPLLTTNLPGAPRHLALRVISRGLSKGVWVPELEPVVAAILGDPDADLVRHEAAAILLSRDRGKYLPAVTGLAMDKTQTLRVRSQLMHLAVQLRPTAVGQNQSGQYPNPLDFQTARGAFELIAELEKDRGGSGYVLALDLSKNLGANFTPAPTEAIYVGPGGARSALFYSHSSSNAVAWWATNQVSLRQHWGQ